MTDQRIFPAEGSNKLVLWLMGASLAALFATVVGYRLMHPDMTSARPMPRAQTQSSMSQQDEAMAHIGALMQQVQANPENIDVVIDLVEHFIQVQQWAPAEQFAQRAAAARPQAPKAHYLLSMALHGLGRHQEAADSLEKAVALDDAPPLRYSLGVLYAYFLNNKAKAAEHFRAGLANPSISPEMKNDLESELAKTAQ